MKKEYLYGLIGFLGGALLVVLFANNAVNSNNTQMMKMMGMKMTVGSSENVSRSSGSHMMPDGKQMANMDDSMSMDDMTEVLKGKTGDAFDEEFIDQMIVHHEGAVDMAQLALENAEHQEIKNMAEAIISTQTSEIQQMKQWKDSWGY